MSEKNIICVCVCTCIIIKYTKNKQIRQIKQTMQIIKIVFVGFRFAGETTVAVKLMKNTKRPLQSQCWICPFWATVVT